MRICLGEIHHAWGMTSNRWPPDVMFACVASMPHRRVCVRCCDIARETNQALRLPFESMAHPRGADGLPARHPERSERREERAARMKSRDRPSSETVLACETDSSTALPALLRRFGRSARNDGCQVRPGERKPNYPPVFTTDYSHGASAMRQEATRRAANPPWVSTTWPHSHFAENILNRECVSSSDTLTH